MSSPFAISSSTTHNIKFCELQLPLALSYHTIATHSNMSSDLIVDFPAQARQSAISVKHKKKMVTFSIMSDIRFYERPDKVHAKELHYSKDDMTRFKMANWQAVRDVHTRHLSLLNDAEVDARAAFQGCELTGIENLLTLGMVRKTMACRNGCWNAVLDEQERQYASGCCDPNRIASASQKYSRWATQRSLNIGIMHHQMSR